MRQAYLEAPRQLVLREVPVPHPAPGEVVVRLRVALTCGTDLKIYRQGHARIPVPAPFGHEGAGEIAAVGEGVKGWRVGERVVWLPTAPCGACPRCAEGLDNLCHRLFEPDRMALGVYADYVRLPADIVHHHLFVIPPAVPDPVAALLEPLACAVRGTQRLRASDDVLVVGAGPMGALLTLVLKVQGVRNLTVVARRPRGAAYVRELGAEVVEGSLKECMGELRIRRPEGFGAVVECTGRPEVWEGSVELVRPGGCVLLFGGLARGSRVRFDAGRLHYDEIAVTGSFHYTTEDAHRAYGLLSRATAELASLITHTRPLQQVVSVFEELDRGMDALKVALLPNAV
ncbi:MAG: alcohol dehydrogenase catalytic domain-containing protein [Armatimonadota bacterium]|nr:alcohol dehydrogenase catalytic domain-containing protein [Armatimonadota bacterium]MDR7438842.1 alcohol dehydrogenase catalytic domain-containing protein [Armatimonadota bacterium]MDR7562699.1 alcohol dehydrogenase catalytic domain-containing protein [Armatimonadota bacterium]MDR7567848.1 alcohol dehydrogenase catalytic domain-containing protein [Armatimonadota bacterium]MDR7602216.1 alcohol dehydrogenase catalytic domain-containing protein [Armatimonadota bacterium]